MKECETIEFKKSLSELKEGIISLVAILNKHGSGELWFGVRNDGVTVGLDVNAKTVRDVSQAVSATIIDRHDFDGDILELIEEAQKYIIKNIHIGMRVKGLYREDVPEISVEAMREAIINAFCHRDFRDPDYVQIAVFKDRVEIRSPGGLFGGLTIARMRKGNVSRRRNPLIADLFRRIRMVEAWGRGMASRTVSRCLPISSARNRSTKKPFSCSRASLRRSRRYERKLKHCNKMANA